jgi:hypothetical protein
MDETDKAALAWSVVAVLTAPLLGAAVAMIGK